MDFNFNFDTETDITIRKSVFDMQTMTLDNEYEGELPEELKKFHYYFPNDGHCLMIIPRNYVDVAREEGCFDDYEIQIPIKFVLEKGYEYLPDDNNYIVGNFDYNDEVGRVEVPDEYIEM